MICNYCKKREAAFYIEQATKDSQKRMHVCMDCAVKNGLCPPPDRVQEAINTMFSNYSKEERKRSEEEHTLCPGCGKNLLDMRTTFSAGCPECYEVFKKEIQLFLKARGVTGEYTGSMPRRLSTFRSSLMDKVDLEAKLKISVLNEDYEKAAIYRDYLRALEKYPVSDGTK